MNGLNEVNAAGSTDTGVVAAFAETVRFLWQEGLVQLGVILLLLLLWLALRDWGE